MKLLLDTNVLIPLEPTDSEDREPMRAMAARLSRAASQQGHQLFIHPASRLDVARDRDDYRRKLREMQLDKYALLDSRHVQGDHLAKVFGDPARQSNDWVDCQLLAAVAADAVDFLVTEDRGIHGKARLVGLQDRVFFIPEAIALLTEGDRPAPWPLPAVVEKPAYALDGSDPIFDSLRADYYPHFDAWLSKCKLEHRRTWAIEGPDSLAGVCIVKPETDGQERPILKICTLKVTSEFGGLRYGELFLKAVFNFAFANKYYGLYLTVFPKHEQLVSLLAGFGFRHEDEFTKSGELVLRKRLVPSADEMASMDSLQVNVLFGPHVVKLSGTPAFVVPIRPGYHRLLFPELEKQPDLFGGRFPFGNGIRKAYLCHAQIRKITPGALLLFYRSGDVHAITCAGVAEEVLVSRQPEVLLRFSSKRTVYRPDEIKKMCERGEVLAIRFRQARLLPDPIRLSSLIEQGILNGAPRSICSAGGISWLVHRLEEA